MHAGLCWKSLRLGLRRVMQPPGQSWWAGGGFGGAIRLAGLVQTGLLDQPTHFSQVLQEEELSDALCSLMKMAFFW